MMAREFRREGRRRARRAAQGLANELPNFEYQCPHCTGVAFYTPGIVRGGRALQGQTTLAVDSDGDIIARRLRCEACSIYLDTLKATQLRERPRSLTPGRRR